jgi:hypothetical protein
MMMMMVEVLPPLPHQQGASPLHRFESLLGTQCDPRDASCRLRNARRGHHGQQQEQQQCFETAAHLLTRLLPATFIIPNDRLLSQFTVNVLLKLAKGIAWFALLQFIIIMLPIKP